MANFKLDTDADGIALITWDMADRSMNVITMGVIEELGTVVDKVANDTAIKGAVITSGKSAFCGGADLTMLDRMAEIFATMVKTKGDQAAAIEFRASAQVSARLAANFAQMARSHAATGREEAVQAIIDAEAAADRARKAAESAGG